MIGLFLGAGFSKWAVGLPLVSELFDFRISPFGVRDDAKLSLVTKLKTDWDAEYPGSVPEKFIGDALSFPKKHRQAVLWYIVRRLSDPFICTDSYSRRSRQHVLMIDEYRKYKIDGVNKAKSFLGQFGIDLSGIITTNYDLLVEYALGTKGFNYGIRYERLLGRGAYPVSTWNNPVVLKGIIPLAKIHGSISWDETSYYTDGRRGITGNALIVAPTAEKQPPSILEFHWSLSEKILTKSEHLAVFGFAFNQYDVSVIDLLKNNGQHIESIILIDIAPNLTAAKALWPKADIHSALPSPDGSAKINEWIRARRL